MGIAYIFIISAYYEISSVQYFYDLKNKCIIRFYGEKIEVNGSCDEYFKKNIKYIGK